MNKEMKISCKQVEKNLIAYIEDNLPETVRKQIAGHLDTCNSCFILYNQVKPAYQVFDHLQIPRMDPGFVMLTELKINKPSHRIIHLLPEPGFLNKAAAVAVVIISITLGIVLGGHIEIPPKSETTVLLNNTGTKNSSSSDYFIVDSGEKSLESIFTNE